MFWIALELSIPKIGFKIMLSLTVKKEDAFKFDRVAESDDTARANSIVANLESIFITYPMKRRNVAVQRT